MAFYSSSSSSSSWVSHFCQDSCGCSFSLILQAVSSTTKKQRPASHPTTTTANMAMESRRPVIASMEPLSPIPPPPPVLQLDSQPMRVTLVDEAPGKHPAMTMDRPLSPLLAEVEHWEGAPPARVVRQAQHHSLRHRRPSAEEALADKAIDELLAEMGIVVPPDALRDENNNYNVSGSSSRRNSNTLKPRNITYYDPDVGEHTHQVNEDTIPEEKPYVVEILTDDEDGNEDENEDEAVGSQPPFMASIPEEATEATGPSWSLKDSPSSSARQTPSTQALAHPAPVASDRTNKRDKGKRPMSYAGPSQYQLRGRSFAAS